MPFLRPSNSSSLSSSRKRSTRNALEDFNKPAAEPSCDYETLKDDLDPSKINAAGNNPDNDPLFEALWNDDSFLKMSEGFNDMMQQIAKEDPTMMAEFQKIQDNLDEPLPNTASDDIPPFNIDDNMSKTLDALTKNLQGLSTEDDSLNMEEMLKQMQQDIGGDGLMKDDDMFSNMMQGMMTNLLSKEMLYPSLKEIRDKYPSWLSENQQKISTQDYEKYKKQETVVLQLCELFERENEDDSESVKKERMDQVMLFMQKMQECGHPPPALLAELSNDGGAQAAPPQCCMM